MIETIESKFSKPSAVDYKNDTRLNYNSDDNIRNKIESLGTTKDQIPGVDVEYYLNELEKYIDSQALQTKKPLDAIIVILDKLQGNGKVDHSNFFNRVIFNHLMEFGNYNREIPVETREFFKTYFTAYESMRMNRTLISGDITYLTQQVDKLKKKLNSLKAKQETFDQTGLSNVSKLKFDIAELKFAQNYQKNEKLKLLIEFDGEKQEIELEIENLRKIYKLKVKNLSKKVSVKLMKYNSLDENWSTIPLERLILKDLDEKAVCKEYSFENFGDVSINFIWINSKIGFINKNLAQVENSIFNNQINLEHLDKSMKYLEKPFEKIFKELNFDNKNYNSNFSKKETGMVYVEKHEVEMSEKIDTAIVKITGNPLIVWENILFFVNKVILVMLMISFFYRSDFITVIILILFILVNYMWFNSWFAN